MELDAHRLDGAAVGHRRGRTHAPHIANPPATTAAHQHIRRTGTAGGRSDDGREGSTPKDPLEMRYGRLINHPDGEAASMLHWSAGWRRLRPGCLP